MPLTRIPGQQVEDASIELVDLASEVTDLINSKADASGLAPVATSGSYNDLEDKPIIPSSLNSLSDVDITTPSADQVLKYDGVGWVNAAAPASGASSLDELSDVAVSSAVKGQFIVHDGNQFVNSNTIEASGAAVKPLILKGAASQTANLFEAQNSSGTTLLQIDSAGQFALPSAASPFVIKGHADSAWNTHLFRVGNSTLSSSYMNVNGDGRASFGLGTNLNGNNTYYGGNINAQVSITAGSSMPLIIRQGSVGDAPLYPIFSVEANTVVPVMIASRYGTTLRHSGDNATYTPLTIIGNHVSQTGDLLKLKNNSNTDVFAISASGSITVGTVPVARVTGLHAVATSGSYNDLSDKPSIPSIVGLATETYVETAVAAVVNSAPAVLDTLNELAAALDDDPNFATTMTTALAAKADSSSLAAVATSGSYTDLSNQPTLFLPTISSPTNGQVLQYNGAAWVNNTLSGLLTNAAQDFYGVKTFIHQDGGGGGGAGGEIRIGNPNFIAWARNYYSLINTSGWLDLVPISGNRIVRFRTPGDTFNNWNLFIECTRDVAFPRFDLGTDSFAGGPVATINITNTLGVGLTAAIGSKFQVNTGTAATKGIIVRGAASQTANLFEVQNSSSQINCVINDGGSITTAGEITVRGSGVSRFNSLLTTGGGVGGNLTNRGFSMVHQVAAETQMDFMTTADASATLSESMMTFNLVQNQIGFNTIRTSIGGQVHITTKAAARKALVVRGAASQTANLLEVQNSAGTALTSIKADGTVSLSTNTTTNGSAGFSASAFAANGNSSELSFYKSRNTTIGSNTIVNAGDYLGAVQFWGANGSSYNRAATIACAVDGTPGASNDMPGRIEFYTTADGAGDFVAERMRLNSAGNLGIGTTGAPGARLHVDLAGNGNAAVPGTIGMIIRGAASQTANLFEIRTSGNAITTSVTPSGTLNTTRFVETSANAFNTSLAPSSGTLTVDSSVGNVVFGALSASVTTWSFTNVPTDNSRVTTVTVVLEGNASFTYGDACSVNGDAVTNGIRWSGGSAPTATANTDIITFVIAKDSAGTVRVFGSATTNFS